MSKIAIRSTGGFLKLKNVILPIVVTAEYFYEGCYRVYAEEFRAFAIDERLPACNNGKGLSHSFYDENKYIVLKEKG